MQTEIEKTLQWADELSEAWVGTTIGKVIDTKKNLVSSNLASIQVLKEVCEYAQKELDEY